MRKPGGKKMETMKNRSDKQPLILTINCNKSSGGGKVMTSLAEFARNKGLRVYTASPGERNEKPSQDHLIVTSHWQKALNWRISKLVGNDCCIPFAQTGKLLRFIERKNPSLVHIHGLHGFFVDYIKLVEFLEDRKIPVVWTQHDCWSFTGKCPHYSDIKCYKWKDECNNCPQLKNYPASAVFDKTREMYLSKKKSFSSLANCVYVPVSKWLENEMKQSFLKGKDIRLISNGVDTSVFRPIDSGVAERYGIHNKKIILGVAASWSARKGLEDFFRLNSRIDKNKAVIVLIGVNDSLASRCKEEGIIPISRTADREELAQWYSKCDMFFNPSVEETFGLVTVEAMACGSPIVGYDATATTEVLEDTPNYCVKPHDLDAVEEAMKQIFSLGKDKFSMLNRKKVLKNYDVDKQYMKYINLYHSLIDR